MISNSNTRNIILLISIIALVTLLISPSVAAEWKDPSWAYRRAITINHLRVSASLTDFPVLIDITDAGMIGKTQANAEDVLFTASDEVTQLSHEIESFDSSTGRLVAWVKIPSLSSATDTIIYMYYGNPTAANQETPESVWDSNFLAVHHLEERSGTAISDSTSKNNDGNALNSVTLTATGKIDGGDGFDGSDDRIALPQVMNSETSFTFEAWINSGSKQGYVISQRDGSSNGAFLQFYPNSFQMYVNNIYIVRYGAANSWHYVVGTYDGTTARLYVDVGTPASSIATLSWPALQTFIGDRSALGRAFQGTLDEIRISDIARSQSYITTSYNNQNSPSTFITLGSEESDGVGPTKPVISGPTPSNNAVDVSTSLSQLSFVLTEPQGQLMDYAVTTNPNIGSRSQNGVAGGTYAVPVSGLLASTTYTWTVSATDGTEQSTQAFSFTTAAPAPSQVTFSEAYPNNINTTFNPRLSLKVTDSQNHDLTIIFESNATGTWEPIATQTGKSGTYYQRTYNMMTNNRRFYWRVSVFDGHAWKTSDAYSVIVKPFILKWTYNNAANTNNGPLAVDVNNDGVYEVFASGVGKVSCLDGLTGKLIWTYRNSGFSVHTPIEIGDLNNDGIMELVAPASNHVVALRATDGSVLWNVLVDSQNKYPLILDSDGNHYPYVYVASGDHFYGTGKLSKLRGTDGSLVAETSAWYPCFSGLSGGDANNDGKLEIYMCDRSTGYEGPEGLGKGMQAYDAEDLSLLWYDGNIICSSNLVAQIDINGDGTLDSVALQQSGGSGGIFIIDGKTGVKMPGKWGNNLGLGTHSPPSIYDIDLDGRLELIASRESPAKVWDIGNWSLDANFSNYNFSEPPRFADVIGDEKLEIIGVTGAIRIYDSTYTLIQSITGVNPIAATVTQDIDADDQNELIVISNKGIINVYETSAYAPTPRVRTNNQLYSEKRVGVGIYEPLPGAPQPIIKEVYPADTAINTDLNPTLRARVVDYHYDKMNVEIAISTDASGPWETVKTFTNADNGWFEYTPANMDGGDTTYYWRVTASDPNADNKVTTQVFSFTTKPKVSMMPGWDYKKKITIDHNKVAGALTNFSVLIEFTDAEVAANANLDGSDIFFTSDGNTKLAHEIESYESTSGHLVAWVNVPLLSNAVDTTLFMYFGNDEAEPQQNPAGVWDANYLSVHHLEETSTTSIKDSTAGHNDGTAFNTTDVQGKIDGADNFAGTTSRITLPKLFTSQTKFTFEGWYYLTTGKNNAYVTSQRNNASQGMLIQYYNGNVQMYVNSRILSRATYTNSWHYVVGTFDGTTARMYVDNNTVQSGSATLTWPDVATIIGNRPANDRAFMGRLDEIRFSRVARSQNYVRTSFNNQNDPVSFITLSAEEVEADATKPAILNELPAHLSEKVRFETTELSFDLFDAQGDLMDYTVTSFPDINAGPVVVTGASNGRVVVPVTGLLPNTEYKWTVQVTDGTETNTKTFSFKTTKAYTFTPIISGNGNIALNVPIAAQYSVGIYIEATAVPAEGWQFIGWAGGRLGGISGTQNPLTITLDENALTKDMNSDLIAFFEPIDEPLIADSDFEHSIDTADLWANATYQDWWESRNNSWTDRSDPLINVTYYAYDYGMLSLDKTNVGGNTGNKAKLIESPMFNGTYRLNANLVQEFSGAQPGTFSVEYDIYVDTILANPDNNESDMTGFQVIGRDSGSKSGPLSGSSDKFIALAFFHEGGSSVPGDSMSLIVPGIESSLSNSTSWIEEENPIASNLQMDKWYHIRIDVNVPARTYNVYVYNANAAGGELSRGSLIASSTNLPAYGTLLSKVSHIGFLSQSSTPGTFYVDNVREYVP